MTEHACTHPNHGAPDHNCAPFLPCGDPSCVCHDDSSPSQPAHREATGGLECDFCRHRGPRDPNSGECGSCGGRSFSPWGDQIDPPLPPPAHGEALAEAAEALRQAERDGYIWLDEGRERVPWESVARWLDERADRLAAHPAHGDNEAALRAAVEAVEALPGLDDIALARWSTDTRYGYLLAIEEAVGAIRAALSASAEPEGGEGR